MELLLKRIARRDTYTIGRLSVDGTYFCDTLEDTDRGLKQALPASVNKAWKIPGRTAIPEGKYRVTLAVYSPRFGSKQQYAFCRGCLPRLINVPAFDGVLIHAGNTDKDTHGCILVGKNTRVGMVTQSLETMKRLYARMKDAGTDIYITIE